MSASQKWFSLLVFIVVIFAGNFIEGRLVQEALKDGWYSSLKQPWYTAPAQVFGPVWMVLYLLMAIAGWLLYIAEPSQARSQALCWYGLQLGLNLLWSIIFFEYHHILLSVIDVIAIWICVVMTMIRAWPVNRLVTYLFIPNLLWITYATWINIVVWLNN